MRKILACFLFLNSLMVFSADTIKMNVDANSQQFKITLPANPTTGFQWTVKEYDKAILKLAGNQYLAPQPKLMGAGGEMCFIFSRVKGATYPKTTTLLFRYSRSWEHKGGIVKKVVVNFRVIPKI